MSQLSTIVIVDDNAVSHTFTREGAAGRAIRFVERHASGKPELDSVLDVTFRRNGNGAYVPGYKLEVPVIEAIDGIDTRVDSNIYTWNTRLGTKGDLTSRQDGAAMASNLIVHTDVSKLWEELQNNVD